MNQDLKSSFWLPTQGMFPYSNLSPKYCESSFGRLLDPEKEGQGQVLFNSYRDKTLEASHLSDIIV